LVFIVVFVFKFTTDDISLLRQNQTF